MNNYTPRNPETERVARFIFENRDIGVTVHEIVEHTGISMKTARNALACLRTSEQITGRGMPYRKYYWIQRDDVLPLAQFMRGAKMRTKIREFQV